MRRLSTLLLLALPCAAFAQSPVPTGAQPPAERRADGWSIGVGAGIIDSPYAGEGTRYRPIPLISYEGERFFFQGITAGYHLINRDNIKISAIVAGRLDGFDIDDLSTADLAANGVDAAHLENRHDGVDAGFSAEWVGTPGRVRLRLLADITDTSDGQEASLHYSYPIRWGGNIIEPGVGARWMSSDLVGYYYGTLDSEVARGAPVYRPGSAVVPRVSVGVVRPLRANWTLIGDIGYDFLPSEITDSPLLEPDSDGAARLLIGISRRF
ncbi:MipA/OmpV family protein [Luteimonas abyssi]|uniref:MipA/OmpV family protein n=1 Tax=Luteimonas abyssi TaxID=1247514 RepID=UPI000737B374|nr:MipA/OmpV family protein [Luteimonas abyssi]